MEEVVVEVEVVDEEEDLEEGVDRKVMVVVEVTAITRPWDPEMDIHQAMEEDMDAINLSEALC